MTERKKYTVPEFQEVVGTPTKLGQIWCPYCGQWTMFVARKYGEGLGYNRCEGCGISTEDWYVRKVNGMFESLGKKKKRK